MISYRYFQKQFNSICQTVISSGLVAGWAIVLQFTLHATAMAQAEDKLPTLTVERDLVFATVDGRDIGADVYRIADEQIRPVVVMIHGGGWITGDKRNLADHAREMAIDGFVAVSINYRLAPKYKYPAAVEDCQAAIVWLEDIAEEFYCDLDRVGVWGYSAGAHLATMIALNDSIEMPHEIRCCVAGGAPCDLTLIPENSGILVPFLGETRSSNQKLYEDASPITHADKDDCPVFFFHGKSDVIVPLAGSSGTYEKLKSLGTQPEQLVLENQGHLLTFTNTDARRGAIEFLKKHLFPKPEK